MFKNFYDGNPAVILIGIIILFLDAFDLVARSYAPNLIQNVACFALPSTKPFFFLFKPESIQNVMSQCSSRLEEPAISLIFLMIKILLVFTALFFDWLDTFLSSYKETRDEFFAIIEKCGGALEDVKDIAPYAIGLFGMACYMLYKIEDNFTTDLISKFYEDIFCLILFISLFLLTYHAFFVWVYCIKFGRKN